MNTKKFGHIFIAFALVALMLCMPLAAYATGAEAPSADTSSAAPQVPVTPDVPVDPAASESAPADTAAPAVETVVVTNYVAVTDEKGATVTDESGNAVTEVVTAYETVPTTAAPAETTAPATPENLVFYPNADSAFGVISVQKGDNGWTVVDGDYYEDPEKAPVYIAIEPGKRDLHGTITVEYDDEDGWVVTESDFYGSKLMVVPIIIITFLVTLALMVAINIIIIKIRKTPGK